MVFLAEGGIGALGLNLPSLIAQLINFTILFLLLAWVSKRFLFPLLDERRKRIQEGLALMAAVFSDPQMAAVMQEARISTADKMALAERTLAGADPLVLNLARLLLPRGRPALAAQTTGG